MFSTTFIASNPHTKIRSDRQISLPASKYIRQPFATPQDTSGITPHSIAILHAMPRCPTENWSFPTIFHRDLVLLAHPASFRQSHRR
jgi:hypothetical protein